MSTRTTNTAGMDALFDIPDPHDGTRRPEPEPTLDFEAPRQTQLEGALLAFRAAFETWAADKAKEGVVRAARQAVATAFRADHPGTDEHTLTWLASGLPHLARVECSCGAQQSGYTQVQWVAAKAANHVQNGAPL